MASRTTRERRAAQGRCVACGESKAQPERRLCSPCRSALDRVKVLARARGWRDDRPHSSMRKAMTKQEARQRKLWRADERRLRRSRESEAVVERQGAGKKTLVGEDSTSHVAKAGTSTAQAATPVPPSNAPVVSPTLTEGESEQRIWETNQAYWERIRGETAHDLAARLLRGGHDEQRLVTLVCRRYVIRAEVAEGIVDRAWDEVE